MMNIISSDIFRLRKGVAMRNVLITVVAAVLMAILTFRFSGMIMSFGIGSIQVDDVTFNAQTGELSVADDLFAVPENGAEASFSILSQNGYALFLLVFVVAVFGADFSAGTYRNTLSFESNRNKVYIAKLLTSVLCLILTFAVLLAASWVGSGIAFGFQGYTADFFVQNIIILLLQAPLYLGILCAGHCMVAFTQKSSSTIAIFLLGLLGWAILIQGLSFLLPRLSWLIGLDILSGLTMLVSYRSLAVSEILIPVLLGVCLTITTLILGMNKFRKTDFS